MLDLSCNYSRKEVKVTISSTLDMKVVGDMKATDHVAVVKLLKEVCEKYSRVNIFNQEDFNEVVKDVKLVERLKEVLCEIRCTHIKDYKAAHREREELRNFVNNNFYGSKYSGKAAKKFSVPQEVVLYDITSKYLFSGVSSENFTSFYAPISRKTDRMIAFYKELIDFPYGKFGAQAIKIRAAIEVKYKKANFQIKAFEAIVDEAGEDLINWSQQKYSRRLNAMVFKLNEKDSYTVSFYRINGWTSKIIESYANKGVEKEVVKPKKEARGETLLKEFNEGKTLTQDEILTVFKQTKATVQMIQKMDLNTVYLVMDSPLKTVKEKVGDFGWQDKYKVNEGGRFLINRAIEIAPRTKENFTRIRTYADRVESPLPWEYIFDNNEFVASSYVLDKARSIDQDIPARFYTTHFSCLEPKILIDTNKFLTKEFVSRLSEEDKINVLPRLGGEFIREGDKQSINFLLHQDWFDYIKDVEFKRSDLFELYKNVPWEAIKPIVCRLPSLMKHAVDLVILNEDKETASIILKECKDNSDRTNIARLLEMFDARTQVKMVLESIEEGQTYYREVFTDVINEPDQLVKMFKAIIGKPDSGFIDKILDFAKKIKMDMSVFRESILKRNDLGMVQLTHSFNKLLDKTTKLHLLRIDCELATQREESLHGTRTTRLNPYKSEFFKDLKRNDLKGILSDNLAESPYKFYLTHAMTPEELGEASESVEFLRTHIELIPYTYLKKYENKEAFKEVAGDRRNSTNNSFALSLERKFEEKLKLKINPANSVKLMFA